MPQSPLFHHPFFSIFEKVIEVLLLLFFFLNYRYFFFHFFILRKEVSHKKNNNNHKQVKGTLFIWLYNVKMFFFIIKQTKKVFECINEWNQKNKLNTITWLTISRKSTSSILNRQSIKSPLIHEGLWSECKCNKMTLHYPSSSKGMHI